MGLNNRSDMEQTMSRKLEMVDARALGEAVPEATTSLPELERAEVQEKILVPESVVIHLVGGDEVELPEEFTLKDIFRNKIHMRLTYYFRQIQGEVALKVDNAILIKPSVQAEFEEMLSEVTGKEKSFFTDRLDIPNTILVWNWMLKTLTALNNPKGKTLWSLTPSRLNLDYYFAMKALSKRVF
jgi:hypothetical protein